MKLKLIIFLIIALQIKVAKANDIGFWLWSHHGLPVYRYTGKLPFKAVDKDGKDALQPEDPFFLLGNYRMALITHASGIYQFITAERAWARINASNNQTNYGWNEACISIAGKSKKKLVLTGINSIATDPEAVKKYFGVGFARYEYDLGDNLACTRILSVKPSTVINTGNPSFIISVVLENKGKQTQRLIYDEKMLVNFVLNSTQYTEEQKRNLLYSASTKIDAVKETALATINYKVNNFVVLPDKKERFMYDVSPPSVFMYAKGNSANYNSIVKADKDTLTTEVAITLKQHETKTFQVVIGIANQPGFDAIKQQVTDLSVNAGTAAPAEGLFAASWRTRLPDLSSEKNEVLRREMLWNAHMVEASAKYSDYYKETFIPQGTVYSYYYGDNISNRDHLAAALAACYTNPQLAKSCIRYVLKHTDFDGEIKRGNSGYGYTEPSLFKESDEQLYFFNTLSEYLLITKDYNFLDETVSVYPVENGKQEIILNLLKKHFIYLRDEIGTGANGLVKMLNSDWSDSFFHKYSPNVFGGTAESHLNTAMVLAVFPKLISALKQSGKPEATEFIGALEVYKQMINGAFMKDLGDRKFVARAYLRDDLKFGIDNVCIEPQGYLLQIPDLPEARKKEMYAYIKSKISTPEKIGIRTRERPIWDGHPDGEDGGIWYSLEYPLLLGVATFDKEEAQSLLLKFSFQNFADHYPQYWVGQWTAPDEINSTLYREGLYAFWVGAGDKKTAFQGYCSHPHTWPLFCYFKIKSSFLK